MCYNGNYDSFGNLLVQDNLASPSAVVYDRNANNQLIRSHDGGATWNDLQYNSVGGLKFYSDGISPMKTYRYTATNELWSIDNGNTASYEYDGLDRWHRRL